MLVQFATVFVFLCLAVVFLLATQAISSLLRPKQLYPSKQTAYECGEEPEGSPWIRFNVRFYLIALFFIVFDVEIIFMMPWAVAFNEMLAEIGPFAYVEGLIFIGILVVGLAYVWGKGDLAWVKGLSRRDVDESHALSYYSSGQFGGDKRSRLTSAKPEGVA